MRKILFTAEWQHPRITSAHSRYFHSEGVSGWAAEAYPLCRFTHNWSHHSCTVFPSVAKTVARARLWLLCPARCLIWFRRASLPCRQYMMLWMFVGMQKLKSGMVGKEGASHPELKSIFESDNVRRSLIPTALCSIFAILSVPVWFEEKRIFAQVWAAHTRNLAKY